MQKGEPPNEEKKRRGRVKKWKERKKGEGKRK
jgi:hypothetical protein